MDPPDSDVVVRRPVITARKDQAVSGQRVLVLRDLITLRQVRIKVVLAGKDRRLMNRTAEGDRRADRVVNGGAVENRQRAGQTETDRTDVGVGRRAESGTTSTKDLGGGQELGVDLETDNRFKLAHCQLSIC